MENTTQPAKVYWLAEQDAAIANKSAKPKRCPRAERADRAMEIDSRIMPRIIEHAENRKRVANAFADGFIFGLVVVSLFQAVFSIKE